MIDIIVKIAGSFFLFSIALLITSFSLILVSILANELYGRFKDKLDS